MVEGNTQHRYKEAATLLEESSPGTKQQFYFGFLKRAQANFSGGEQHDAAEIVACSQCGAPTVKWDAAAEPVCSFCKTKALAHRRREQGDIARSGRGRH